MTNPTDAALGDLSAHMRRERDLLARMICALEKLNFPDPLQSEAFAAYRAAGLARADFDRLHWRARKAWAGRQSRIGEAP
jgi:hypothetical protein